MNYFGRYGAGPPNRCFPLEEVAEEAVTKSKEGTATPTPKKMAEMANEEEARGERVYDSANAL